jgi:peptide deformylase
METPPLAFFPQRDRHDERGDGDNRGLVPRYQLVVVSYFDQFGKKKRPRLEGFQARVFQHEIDHLNGTLYVDRMPDMKSLMTLDEFKKRVVKRTGLKSR